MYASGSCQTSQALLELSCGCGMGLMWTMLESRVDTMLRARVVVTRLVMTMMEDRVETMLGARVVGTKLGARVAMTMLGARAFHCPIVP